MTALTTILLFSTALRYYPAEERALALMWATINTVWAYYMFGVTCWALAYFHVLCFYLRLRFKRLNKVHPDHPRH